MLLPSDYSFPRYLAAKKNVDDRALNRFVWQALAGCLPQTSAATPLRVLEIGAGIGTMLERMLSWGLLDHARYTGIDAQAEHIAHAHQHLPDWANQLGFSLERVSPDGWILENENRRIHANFEAVDLFDFAAGENQRQAWDLLVAHAFMDLMDIPTTLPVLADLLTPGGLFHFSLNFDGATLLEPLVDPQLDGLIQDLYHQTMDKRLAHGRPSGDSQSGRHLFQDLKHAGAQILAAGASDWVIFPGAGGYPQDETYFLHFILHTIEQALKGHPQLDAQALNRWAALRHAQVENGELVYIAHQLDFAGKF